MRRSFWQNDCLITHILFELQPIVIFSPVANFGDQSLKLKEWPYSFFLSLEADFFELMLSCKKFIEIHFSVECMARPLFIDTGTEINSDDTQGPIVQISPQVVTLKVIPDQAIQVDFKVKVSNCFKDNCVLSIIGQN